MKNKILFSFLSAGTLVYAPPITKNSLIYTAAGNGNATTLQTLLAQVQQQGTLLKELTESSPITGRTPLQAAQQGRQVKTKEIIEKYIQQNSTSKQHAQTQSDHSTAEKAIQVPNIPTPPPVYNSFTVTTTTSNNKSLKPTAKAFIPYQENQQFFNDQNQLPEDKVIIGIIQDFRQVSPEEKGLLAQQSKIIRQCRAGEITPEERKKRMDQLNKQYRDNEKAQFNILCAYHNGTISFEERTKQLAELATHTKS